MTSARQVAYRCLQRIDHDGAYANLLLQSELGLLHHAPRAARR